MVSLVPSDNNNDSYVQHLQIVCSLSVVAVVFVLFSTVFLIRCKPIIYFSGFCVAWNLVFFFKFEPQRKVHQHTIYVFFSLKDPIPCTFSFRWATWKIQMFKHNTWFAMQFDKLSSISFRIWIKSYLFVFFWQLIYLCPGNELISFISRSTINH